MANFNPNTTGLVPPVKGERRNPNGRPKGSRDRTTIIREVLALGIENILPLKAIDKIKEAIPDADRLTNEELMTIRILQKVLIEKDVNAYNALMNNGYKPHTQKVENTNYNVKDLIDEIDKDENS